MNIKYGIPSIFFLLNSILICVSEIYIYICLDKIRAEFSSKDECAEFQLIFTAGEKENFFFQMIMIFF